MPNFYITTNEELTAEANAIRQMTGKTDVIEYQEGIGFSEEILTISTPPIKNVQGSGVIVVPAQGTGNVGMLPTVTIQNIVASAQIVEA